MNTTRRQHYVWKHYLKPWETNGRVAVLQKQTGKVFNCNPVNLAVMKDFYRLPDLTEDDEQFLRTYIEATHPSEIQRRLQYGWLNPIAEFFRTKRMALSLPNVDPALIGEFKKIEIQAVEEVLTSFEGSAIPLLDDLYNEYAELWREDEKALNFSNFLSFQYTRTKRAEDRAKAAFQEGAAREKFLRRRPILRLVSATTFGWSIYSERSDWVLRILRSSPSKTFVTSDQPVINLLNSQSHNDMALYYPVTPKLAAILEHRSNQTIVGKEDNLDDDMTDQLNRYMFNESHEQVYAHDRLTLETLRDWAVARQHP